MEASKFDLKALAGGVAVITGSGSGLGDGSGGGAHKAAWEWQYHGGLEGWQPFTPLTQATVEQALHRGEDEARFAGHGGFTYVIDLRGASISARFDGMQHNLQIGTARNVRRVAA